MEAIESVKRCKMVAHVCNSLNEPKKRSHRVRCQTDLSLTARAGCMTLHGADLAQTTTVTSNVVRSLVQTMVDMESVNVHSSSPAGPNQVSGVDRWWPAPLTSGPIITAASSGILSTHPSL